MRETNRDDMAFAIQKRRVYCKLNIVFRQNPFVYVYF
jgi:hypothetical protein